MSQELYYKLPSKRRFKMLLSKYRSFSIRSVHLLETPKNIVKKKTLKEMSDHFRKFKNIEQLKTTEDIGYNQIHVNLNLPKVCILQAITSTKEVDT